MARNIFFIGILIIQQHLVSAEIESVSPTTCTLKDVCPSYINDDDDNESVASSMAGDSEKLTDSDSDYHDPSFSREEQRREANRLSAQRSRERHTTFARTFTQLLEKEGIVFPTIDASPIVCHSKDTTKHSKSSLRCKNRDAARRSRAKRKEQEEKQFARFHSLSEEKKFAIIKGLLKQGVCLPKNLQNEFIIYHARYPHVLSPYN